MSVYSRSVALVAILLTMMFPADPVCAQDAIPPGVPLTLARERSARIRHVRYELRFSVPAVMTAAVTGSVTIHFTLADASRPLVLDFAGSRDRVREVRAGSAPIAV